MGYDAVGGGNPFVINEESFRSVSFIFQAYHDRHLQPTEIARQLNDMGRRTRRGTLFEARNILYILRNRFYVGKIIWNGIERDGTHETRISQEVFDDVQKSLNALYKPIRRRNVGSCKHWLSGLLKCSVCGASLAFNSQGKGGTQYFNCWKYAKGFHRQSSSISARKAEAAVVEFFNQILSGMDFEFSYHAPENDDSDQLDEYKKELERIDTRELRIKLAYENGIDTIDEYKENKMRIKEERERIQSMIKELDTPQNVPDKDIILNKVRTVLDVIQNNEVDYEVKGNLMRSVVEEIIFDRETETFTFRLYTTG